MKATTIEVKASHLSLISHPHEITNLILNAAGQSGYPLKAGHSIMSVI
jgi:hypothetical protein